MAVDVPFKLELCIIRPNDYSIEFPSGETKVLQPKFIQVLAYLSDQFPRLVTREELIEEIWAGNFPVGEKALTNAIWNLRNEFKPFGSITLETVRKKGYRLLIKPEYLDVVTALNQERKPTVKERINSRGKWLALIAVGMIFVTTLWLSVFLPPKNNKALVINVTTEPGREVYPMVSPDKRYLVFSWRHITQSPNLYLKDLRDKQAKLRQVTFTENYEGRAVWHPNSEIIYFQRKQSNFVRCDVVRLNISTMEEKNIATCSAAVDFSLAISPDGNALAYIDMNQDNEQLNVKIVNLSSDEVISTLWPCQEKCVYQDLDVAFSPDGKQLALSRTLSSGMNEDLFLYDLDKKHFEYLAAVEGHLRGLAWHPSGDRIIYGAEESGQRNGYLVYLKDRRTINLNVSGFSYPSFIPNSHDVVFHSRKNMVKLATLDLSETGGATLFPLIHSNYTYKDPHYSEANNSIAFISTESGSEEIWSANVDGGSRKQLTELKSHLLSPRWSHNAEYIAFLAPDKQTKRSALFVLNIKTGQLTQVNSDFDEYFRPSWLRDDSGLIAGAKLNKKIALYAFPLDDTPPQMLVNQAVTYAEQAKNGDIWFARGRNKGLWRYSPSNKTAQPVQVLANEVFQVGYHWELTDSGVYFQHDHTNYHQIKYFDIQSKKITPVVKLPFGTISRKSSITLIPSLNKLVISQQEFANTDIKQLSHPSL